MTKLFTIGDIIRHDRPDQMIEEILNNCEIEKISNNCKGDTGKKIVETLSQVDRYGCSILHAIVGRKPGRSEQVYSITPDILDVIIKLINMTDEPERLVHSILEYSYSNLGTVVMYASDHQQDPNVWKKIIELINLVKDPEKKSDLVEFIFNERIGTFSESVLLNAAEHQRNPDVWQKIIELINLVTDPEKKSDLVESNLKAMTRAFFHSSVLSTAAENQENHRVWAKIIELIKFVEDSKKLNLVLYILELEHYQNSPPYLTVLSLVAKHQRDNKQVWLEIMKLTDILATDDQQGFLYSVLMQQAKSPYLYNRVFFEKIIESINKMEEPKKTDIIMYLMTNNKKMYYCQFSNVEENQTLLTIAAIYQQEDLFWDKIDEFIKMAHTDRKTELIEKILTSETTRMDSYKDRYHGIRHQKVGGRTVLTTAARFRTNLDFWNKVTGWIKSVTSERQSQLVINILTHKTAKQSTVLNTAARFQKPGFLDIVKEWIGLVSNEKKSWLIETILTDENIYKMTALMMAANYQQSREFCIQIFSLIELANDDNKPELVKKILEQRNKKGETLLMLILQHQRHPEILAVIRSFVGEESRQNMIHDLLKYKTDSGDTVLTTAANYRANIVEIQALFMWAEKSKRLELMKEILTDHTDIRKTMQIIEFFAKNKTNDLTTWVEDGEKNDLLRNIFTHQDQNGDTVLTAALKDPTSSEVWEALLNLIQNADNNLIQTILTHQNNDGLSALMIAISREVNPYVWDKLFQIINKNKDTKQALIEAILNQKSNSDESLSTFIAKVENSKKREEVVKLYIDMINMAADDQKAKFLNDLLLQVEENDRPMVYYIVAGIPDLTDIFKYLPIHVFCEIIQNLINDQERYLKDFTKDFFYRLIELVKNDKTASHLLLKLYFNKLNCEQFDESSVKTISRNSKPYATIYRILFESEKLSEDDIDEIDAIHDQFEARKAAEAYCESNKPAIELVELSDSKNPFIDQHTIKDLFGPEKSTGDDNISKFLKKIGEDLTNQNSDGSQDQLIKKVDIYIKLTGIIGRTDEQDKLYSLQDKLLKPSFRP